jgi:hypothetical protein
MKAQISIEFLASALIFLLAVVFALNILTDSLPRYIEQKEEESINVEMKRISDHLIKKEGEQNWVDNPRTADNIGLTNEYMVINSSKLQELENLNYNDFTEAMDLDHTYKFKFREFPTIDTSKTFKKGNGSSLGVDEPSSATYSGANEKIRYGKREFGGDFYHFLNTAHDNNYDEIYISSDKNFETKNPHTTGDSVDLGGEEYKIKNLQNEGDHRGTTIILTRKILDFGAPTTTGSREVINRYASYNDGGKMDLMRIRVIGW